MNNLIDPSDLTYEMEDWIKMLPTAEPIGRWVSESPDILGVNFAGDIETRVHKIGDYYLVVTNGGGQDPYINWFDTFAEVSAHMKYESERGNPEDGWRFSIEVFNILEDKYEQLPQVVKDSITPWEIICMLTEWDDETSSWLLWG